ncbi:MAG: hypothetical protein M5R40_13175 [Anaerolineae bacterium]|nr:hypothetical protein [Anaerolineae bacterium]
MTLERLWWALVRFGFRLLYNELAFTYDLVSRVVSLGQWRAWQRAAFSLSGRRARRHRAGDCARHRRHAA